MAGEYRGIEVFGRQPSTPRRAPKSRRRAPNEPGHARLGFLALGAGIATVLFTAIGIASSMGGNFEAGTLIAYLAIVLSIVAVLAGLAALLLGRGRAWGILAIALGVLASPPVLTRLLDWASGLG